MRVGRTFVGLTVLGLLVACTPAEGETPTPSPSPTMTTSATTEAPSRTPEPTTESPSPTPTPSETLDADQIAARDVVNEFFRLTNELLKDPEMPLQPLADITTGRTQEEQLKEIADLRGSNAIQVGDDRWVILTVSEATERSDETRVVVVHACSDTSQLDIVDRDTRVSLLPPERATHLRWTMDVVLLGGFWKVSDLSNERVDECPAG